MDKAERLPLWDESQSKETPESPEESVLTVSEVNRLARKSLEKITVTVQGEVSGLATGYAYYVYFDLRDAEAALPALLTQKQFKDLGFALESGMSVVVRGALSIYERQGKYQIRVSEIKPFGEGDIQRRIEALKRKLHAEGLFDDALKKPLPVFPARVGVVTSPRGAAIRDVVVTISRRFPPASVFIRGVTVQGKGAVEEICAGLGFFDAAWPVDAVILARGGGSLQDLEPFNSEEVARAIARMKTPVVSGIGHEPDVTIADLVADRRASTPTAAAEAVAPEKAEVCAGLAKTAAVITRSTGSLLQEAGHSLDRLRRRPLYRAPESLLGPFMQRWERDATALPSSPRRGLLKNLNRLEVITGRPVYRRPRTLLGGLLAGLLADRARFLMQGARTIERVSAHLHNEKARIKALSPLAVLERGYSITFNRETGAILRASDEVDVGAPLKIKLGRGELEADVTGKE